MHRNEGDVVKRDNNIERLIKDSYNICPDEGQMVLASIFPSARWSDKEITLWRSGENEYEVKFHIDRRNRIERIEKGPKGTDSLLELLYEKLKTDMAKQDFIVGNEFLYIHGQGGVDGFFRRGKEFQLLSVPPEFPYHDVLYADYPCVLQFSFYNSPNRKVRHFRAVQRARELTLLLNLFLTTRIKAHRISFALNNWVFDNGAEFPDTKTENYSKMFPIEVGDFDDVSNHKPLRQIPYSDYYSLGRNALSRDIPDVLNALFDKYETLSQMDRDKLFRAAFWLQYASFSRSHCSSASFTAIMSAIETILPKGETCSECGQIKKVSKRFSEFVQEFSGVDASITKKYYSSRSRLSHGSELLIRDIKTSVMGGGLLDQIAFQQQWDYEQAHRTAKNTVIGWLLKTGHPKL